MDCIDNKGKNKNTPLVSAVITTHNRLDYLKLAIDSVINQTYKNIEIIVVNDNSDNDTTMYLDSLEKQRADFRHIYISEEESHGGNYARNKGIDAANGEYVAFLDDDDEWLSEKIEKQIPLFNDRVGMVYCGRYLDTIEDNGVTTRKERLVEDDYLGDVSKKCFRQIFCTTSAMVVKKNILIRAGKFDEDLFFWQETDLSIRICQITYVDAVKEPLVILRINKVDPNRLSNKYDGWMVAVKRINEKYKDLIEQLPEEYQKQRRLMILQDKAQRLDACGRFKEARQARYEKWKITRDVKDLLRCILNRSVIIERKNKEKI